MEKRKTESRSEKRTMEKRKTGSFSANRTMDEINLKKTEADAVSNYSPADDFSFLPISRKDMEARGIKQLDFVYITGDAYVDHPSFGAAIICRLIESLGYTVGIIPQPDWRSVSDFTRLGRPRLAFMVSSGNIDSMVNHYTAAKKPRSEDLYSPGGKSGRRPDRAIIVYCNRIREAYGDVPIIIGGLEASLRRFAHYDYWQNDVRRSILFDSGADILSYGMGEHQTREIVERLAAGESVRTMTDIAGTCVIVSEKEEIGNDNKIETGAAEKNYSEVKILCERKLGEESKISSSEWIKNRIADEKEYENTFKIEKGTEDTKNENWDENETIREKELETKKAREQAEKSESEKENKKEKETEKQQENGELSRDVGITINSDADIIKNNEKNNLINGAEDNEKEKKEKNVEPDAEKNRGNYESDEEQNQNEGNRGTDNGGIKWTECPSFEKVRKDKREYAKATKIQFEEQDPYDGKIIYQKHSNKYLKQNPPAKPLNQHELDEIYSLPFTRKYHPVYEKEGGVPAILEVSQSITHNRGCFGGCNFCAITFHQGRYVTSRSKKSIVKEAEAIAADPNFKGYIHDIGGPTANFRYSACQKKSPCKNRKCLAPTPCPALKADHTEYLDILRTVRNLPKVKKVFVRSGIRFDYMLLDKNDEFFNELVKYHVSGQLKVAPEHCSDNVLKIMGKPPFRVYEKFQDKFRSLNKKYGLKQYLVPYLMSSHPGSTLADAIELALYLRKMNYHPEQVQDFYPTPGTLSTAMFWTGLDPMTMKPVYVPKTAKEKAMQRALLQYSNPKNEPLVRAALTEAGRKDLIPLFIKRKNFSKTSKLTKKPKK